MEENFDALEVIARTRGKVDMGDVTTRNKLFPLWGWLTAVFYLAEFILWPIYGQQWCLWLWIGIPLVGTPLMIRFIRKDRERTHMRSRKSKLVLDYWLFASCTICIGGFLFGFVGVYEMVENPMICLLVGIGAFITGEEMRFRPMIVGGLIGTAIGLGSFLLLGDLWYWQTLCVVLTAVSALIVPGHMHLKNGI